MSLLTHTGTKMVVKRMDEEAERERERNLCQAMMIAVTLDRWNPAGILLLSSCN